MATTTTIFPSKVKRRRINVWIDEDAYVRLLMLAGSDKKLGRWIETAIRSASVESVEDELDDLVERANHARDILTKFLGLAQ